MKKTAITIIIILILFGVISAISAYVTNGSDADIKDVKYYNNLIENQKIVTIELTSNAETRKATKSELINFDKNIQNIKKANGDSMSDSDLVKTGDFVTVNNADYQVVLYGDVNKDGTICDIDDIMIIENNYLGTRDVNDIEKLAGNLENNDSVLDIEDIMKMVNVYLGKSDTDIVSKVPEGYITNNSENMEEQTQTPTPNPTGTTPVATHGKLSVSGTNIVDKNGNNFQLKGVSTHGIAWFPQYVNQDAFIYMRDNWGINAVRLAMYSSSGEGYTKDIHNLVSNGVEYAKNAGIYIIIDWHILAEGNPNTGKENAKAFFTEMATKYKDYDNVIYEICNEPNGDVQWVRDVKPYAEEIIPVIRNIDDDAIIVVGTPTWSQDVDVAAQNPITGYSNIMYSLHFYAATHKDYLRQKLQTALNAGLPIFVTEFGICDASGNGGLDITEANTWIDYLNQRNISWMCWSLCNKAESASIIKSSVSKVTGWTQDELSDCGKWLLQALKR